jgi:hypothetical protein
MGAREIFQGRVLLSTLHTLLGMVAPGIAIRDGVVDPATHRHRDRLFQRDLKDSVSAHDPQRVDKGIYLVF